MTSTIHIALVDDQQLVRAGLAMVIGSQPDLSVVAEASDGKEAVNSVEVTGADIILMDVRMPHMNGLEAAQHILAKHPTGTPKIIMLTTFDLDEYLLDAITAGASGFLLKDTPPEDLLSAIRNVHRGDAVLAPSATRKLVEHFVPILHKRSDNSTKSEKLSSLSPRETEVLHQVARGKSNQEIAEELVVSEATVKTHVGHILQKFQARDRVQLVVFAYEYGLIVPGVEE